MPPLPPMPMRPERHGVPVMDPIPPRPARSPPRPSMPATSPAPARTGRSEAHLPQGTLVAIAGGKQAEDATAIAGTLDRLKAKYADVILVHGGGPGAEKIAARWAEHNGVHQIVCKPEWDKHGRAAPFRRTTICSICCPRVSSPSPAQASPTTWWTKPSAWAYRSAGLQPDRRTPRAASSSRRCGPRHFIIYTLRQSAGAASRAARHRHSLTARHTMQRRLPRHVGQDRAVPGRCPVHIP